MRALRILLEDAIQEEACAIYTADVLGAVANCLFRMGGAEVKMQIFSDLMKPPEPVKTGQEVFDDLMDRLDKLGARR